MVTLFVSFAVIVLVCSVVGRLCSRSRPGSPKLGPEPVRRHRSHIDWPDVVGGDAGDSTRYANLPPTHHHSSWGYTSHSHGHSHSHDGGGWSWGGDSGGGFDGGGGGGGGD